MRIIDADKLKEELRGWLALPNRDNDARDVISHQIAAIDNAPTVDTTCPHCDSGYAQGYSDGYLKGKEERPQAANNAELFKQTFGIYATEMWAMSESDFLEWLNAEVTE